MASVNVITFVLVLLPVSAAVKVALMKPSNNGTFDVAVVVTPGADIDGMAYKPLGETIQQLFPGRMWIVLLYDFVFNVPNPASLEYGFGQAVNELKLAGFQGNNIYLAGHSLGGLFVAKFGQSNPDKVKGVILFAAYLTRGNHLRDYPVPVMTISGDIDGLCRVTRIVDTFEELENETVHNPSPMSLIYTRPVIVMRGLNHGCFASGKMPPKVAKDDIALDDDVTLDSAHKTIAWHVIDFIIVDLRQPNEDFLTAIASMKVAFFTTQEIIRPLSAVKAIDTNTKNLSNTSIQAQLLIVGEDLTSHVKVSNIEIPEQYMLFYEPDVTLNGSIAHVQTISSVVMPSNPLDDSAPQQAPSELQAVMKTKAEMQAILKAISKGGDTVTCRDLNKQIVAMAVNASSEVARARAVQRSSPNITFHDDLAVSTTLEWIEQTLDLSYGPNGELNVTSYSHVTNVEDNPLDKSSGLQYCKLLSPYRAMEWFYIDSLKRT